MTNRWSAYLTLDVATTTGFCLWADRGSLEMPRIRCGSWHCEGSTSFEKACALSDHLQRLMEEVDADGGYIKRAGIEAPMERVPTKKVQAGDGSTYDVMDGQPKTMAILTGMACGAGVLLHRWGVSFEVVAPSTWRKTAIGMGKAPRGQGSKWLKAEMRIKAEMLGDKFGFTVPNNDASDAVGIAVHLMTQQGLYHPRMSYGANLFGRK